MIKCAQSLFLLALIMLPAFSFAADLPALVTTDWLQKNLNAKELVIVDVRSSAEYLEGHIGPEIGRVTRFLITLAYAGVNTTAMLDGGINKWNKDVIAYCNTGVLSTFGWFVLDRRLGCAKVRMYDGSMEEWTKDPAAPVEQ